MNDQELIELFARGMREVEPEKANKVLEIGLDGNLNDLALDSIATMELVAYVEEQVGARFHDDDLAQLSTFSQLADLVRRSAAN